MADEYNPKDKKQSNWMLAALHSFLDDREVEKQNKANELYKDMFKNASEISPHYMGHGKGGGGRGMVDQGTGGGGPAPGLVQAMAPSPFVGGPGDAAAVPTVLRPSQDTTTGLVGYDQMASTPQFTRPAEKPYWDENLKQWMELTPKGPMPREDLGGAPPMPVTERAPLTPDEAERMAALSRPDPYAPVPAPPMAPPLAPLSPYVPPGTVAPFIRTPTKFSSGG